MDSVLKKLALPDVISGAGSGNDMDCSGEIMVSNLPIDGIEIGKVRCAAESDVVNVIDRATEAFKTWRMVPAPLRGDVVRQIGNALRNHKG